METPEQYNAKPTLVQINTPNLRDVPAGLRRLADLIEAGECPAAKAAIVVAVDPEDIAIYGYGSVGSNAECIGILFKAAILLAGKQE